MNKISSPNFYQSAINLTVIVAGLGYLVDTFDFFLYNSMRVVSLKELGLSGDALTHAGMVILNCQIFGALVGSFSWGILGDRVGRKKGLVGSILLYSAGMIATGFVHDTTTYAIVRMITGFGVAGEVGLGATLVAETVPAKRRTYALMFFTLMGLLGIVAAGMSLEFISWRVSCWVGGGIGLLLLTLRSRLSESQAFLSTAESKVRRGSLKELLGRPRSLKLFLLCIPVLGTNYFVTGILLTLSPEIAAACGVTGTVKANIALSVYFSAAVAGDFLSAWLSQKLRRRRIVAAIFVAGNLLITLILLQRLEIGPNAFYGLCAALGLFNLWAISATILVEQFPTELRATDSTSNVNLSRGLVILMNLALMLLKPIGLVHGLLVVACCITSAGLFCLWRLPESYDRALTEPAEDLPIF